MSKKYKIRIDYITGDSYGSYEKESYIDLEWDNLDIAKENLQAIKEHWEFYTKTGEHSYHPISKEDRKAIIEKYSTYWWYPESKDLWTIKHCMKLKADNGSTMQQSNFWCGYFERLIGAEIIINNDDMSFKV